MDLMPLLTHLFQTVSGVRVNWWMLSGSPISKFIYKIKLSSGPFKKIKRLAITSRKAIVIPIAWEQ